MDGQQSARVNIDDRDWIRFRIRALEEDRSIADYLGDLVRAELSGRGDPIESVGDRTSAEDATSPSAMLEASPMRAGKARRVRVSEVHPLVSLPGTEGQRSGVDSEPSG